MQERSLITNKQIRDVETKLNAVMHEKYAPLDGTYVCIDSVTIMPNEDYTIYYNIRYGRKSAAGRVIFQEHTTIDNPGGRWPSVLWVAKKFYEVLDTLNRRELE